MPFDYAVHSDLLVYWTGRDIDKQYDPCWDKRNSSDTNPEYVVKEKKEAWERKRPQLRADDEERTRTRAGCLERCYLERLRSILEHGLWMTTPSDTDTEPDSELTLYVNKVKHVSLPKDVARVCFTELRLSEARTHAMEYGGLGIGVKRPFVLDRGGRPVIYLGRKANRERDAFFDACDRLFKCADRPLLHFLKPMHSGQRTPDDWYAESEWRIVYGDLLDPTHRKSGYPGKSHRGRCSVCVKAHKPSEQFLDSLSDKDRKVAERRLRYLLPLDGWLSCIIYPSVALKRKAVEDQGIREEIARIKSDTNCRANDVERGNWPVEMDLDLCRNF